MKSLALAAISLWLKMTPSLQTTVRLEAAWHWRRNVRFRFDAILSYFYSVNIETFFGLIGTRKCIEAVKTIIQLCTFAALPSLTFQWEDDYLKIIYELLSII